MVKCFDKPEWKSAHGEERKETKEIVNTNSSTDLKRLNDDIVRNPKYPNNKKQSKKAYEKKIEPKLETIRYLSTMQSPMKLQENQDNQKIYEPNNIESIQVKKVRCSYESQSYTFSSKKNIVRVNEANEGTNKEFVATPVGS